MLNTIAIKRRLSEKGNFSEAQSEDLAEELGHLAESEIATKKHLDTQLELLRKDLRKEFGWWAFGLLIGNGTITAALLALYGAA